MDSDKEKRLREIIKRGDKVEPLKELLAEFYEVEKAKAVIDLLNTTKDPKLVKADLRAAKRLIDYFKVLTVRANTARKMLDK